MKYFLLLACGTVAWPADFTRDVQPVLSRYCYQCHGETTKMGGLDVRTPALILKGGAKGAAVVKGNAGQSILYQRIVDQSMPMGPKKLTAGETQLIKEWIDAGAAGATAHVVQAKQQKHWAFQPPQRPELPKVSDTAWVRTPVDAFVLREIEKRGIRPAAEADPATLLRRLYLTLTGLPPTPEESQAFASDRSPDAYDKVLDRLLASPRYGERWARHWLDVVRYAESNGYERDGTKPSAWRYRDWAIHAFQSNKPFNRFLTEQLAGDEMDGANASTQIATTFLRLGVWDDEPADELTDRYDQLDDVLAVTAQAFMGVTLRCARCHDHKFEPLSQKDYYRVLAVFEPLKRPLKGRTELDREVGSEAELKQYHESMRAADAEIDPLRRLVANLKRGLLERLQAALPPDWQEPLPTVLALRVAADKRNAAQRKLADAFERKLDERMLALASQEETRQLADWNKRIADIEQSRPKAPPRAYIWYEDGSAPPTRLFHRGEAAQPREVVEPGVPEVLGGSSFESPSTAERKSAGRRMWLANWLTSPANPLVARVFVNRVWQWHFGEGLVATANDFGVMGQRPSHPELLDYLATEFVRSGWNVKELQKLILRSRTFRLSAAWEERSAKLDPEQTLLWRWRPRRLEAEAVRDATLAVSGQLNLKMHGPSIFPTLPEAVMAGQSRPGDGWGKSSDAEASRRSVYIFAKRGLLVPEMDLLDTPDTTVSCERRRVSTTGAQALTLLNGSFAQTQARHFAERVEREAGSDDGPRVERAFQLAFSRSPRPDERDNAFSFLARQQRQLEQDGNSNARGRALQDLCLVLLNTNDFFYLK